MTHALAIGQLAKRAGVSPKTIRFYEDEGLLAPAARSPAGYRLYGSADLRRLRLIRRSRLLGLPLAEVRTLVDQAFASSCAEFAGQLVERIRTQRAAIEQRMAELTALQAELAELERHVLHDQATARPGQLVADCGFCPQIDDKEGGERGD